MLVFDAANPPLESSAAVLREFLLEQPRRLAFAGKAGAGKTTLCETIAQGTEIPIFNHADGVKEEVLEWIAVARNRALIPGERATFESFCDFLGISPSIVEHDMWEILGPVWTAMSETLESVYHHRLPVIAFAGLQPGEQLAQKVKFVDQNKPLFRSALQNYAEATRLISGNDDYWVDQTIARCIPHPVCLNGDTRFASEAEILRYTGWTVIYLDISEETQIARRPEMTPEQRAHHTEHGIGPEHCDLVLDANQTLAKLILDLSQFLPRKRKRVHA